MPSFYRQTQLRDVPAVLRRFREGADPRELQELLVFTRGLFVLGEHGFAQADEADVAAFMDPARGLELWETRRRMFARLLSIVPNPAFDIPASAEPPTRLAGAALMAELRRRTQDKLARLTQAQALRAERRSMPYYAALREAFGAPRVDTSHYEPVVAEVEAFVRGRTGALVLDIACAYGLLLEAVAARMPAAHLVGTDILSMPGRIVALGNAQPLRDGSCDVVTATSLLEHVVDPFALVREMARVVKPEGLVVAVTTSGATMQLSRDPRTWVRGFLAALWPALTPPYHDLYEPLSPLTMPHRMYTRDTVRRLFAPHFDDVRVTAMQFLHLRRFGLEGLAPRLPLLRRFGAQFLVTARRPRRLV